MKPGLKGLSRIFSAARYSLAGLGFAYREEAAFRQELWLFLLLLPAGLFLGGSGAERSLLIGSLVLVLVTELLNTAIEAAVDRGGDAYDPLAKCAKDAASAAVFVSLLLAGLVWVLILWDHLAAASS